MFYSCFSFFKKVKVAVEVVEDMAEEDTDITVMDSMVHHPHHHPLHLGHPHLGHPHLSATSGAHLVPLAPSEVQKDLRDPLVAQTEAHSLAHMARTGARMGDHLPTGPAGGADS